MPHRLAKQINEVLKVSESILLVPHQNPDGDACGSVSALADFLLSAGKKVDIYCKTDAPESLKFLPHLEILSTQSDIWGKKHDAIIICDSGDPVYAGVDRFLPKPDATLIVIDHHPTNTGYGDINLVTTTASSTTEILYQMFVAIKAEITPHMATALLTGLFTDTGIFSNSGTSKDALSIAGILVKKGADLPLIRKYIIKDKRMHTLRLWGRALTKLTHDTELDVVYTRISLEDILVSGSDEASVSGIANLMNTLKEGKIRIMFHEKNDHTVKVSMRAVYDNADVSVIAQEFGGGGHKKAAGFSIPGPIEKAYEHILPVLNKYLKQDTIK